jgi:hypothetical protein
MPGGVPLWPGKAPNPGGRPYGDAVHSVRSVQNKVKLQGQGFAYLHKGCTPFSPRLRSQQIFNIDTVISHDRHNGQASRIEKLLPSAHRGC